MSFKDAIRKRIAPTNADRYAQAKELRRRNQIKLQKVKSMEAVAKQRTAAKKLQEREKKAKAEMQPSWMKQDKPSSQKVSKAYSMGKRDPFEAFNSPLFGGSSGGNSGKGKRKEPDFPDFNFL